MGERIDFNEICQKVSFLDVVNWLGLEHKQNNGEIKGEGFIANQKDGRWVYFDPGDKNNNGTIINFVSKQKGVGLRDAGKLLKDQFLTMQRPQEPKRSIPTLTLEYHPFLSETAPEDLCKALNVGFCKEKSIMAGRICFKVGEHYIGYSPEKKDWLFPKNFRRDSLWNIGNCDRDIIFVTKDPFTALKMVASGYQNTASIMGVAPTEEQKGIVSRFSVALCDY
ncbi:MAG: hypothetical protein CSYNP_03113 [Syntrophus sp. SKADARSKE-3]|nr:hypothetical protein [Syntrophus sp. SKADARSKE-3]